MGIFRIFFIPRNIDYHVVSENNQSSIIAARCFMAFRTDLSSFLIFTFNQAFRVIKIIECCIYITMKSNLGCFCYVLIFLLQKYSLTFAYFNYLLLTRRVEETVIVHKLQKHFVSYWHFNTFPFIPTHNYANSNLRYSAFFDIILENRFRLLHHSTLLVFWWRNCFCRMFWFNPNNQ